MPNSTKTTAARVVNNKPNKNEGHIRRLNPKVLRARLDRGFGLGGIYDVCMCTVGCDGSSGRIEQPQIKTPWREVAEADQRTNR